MKQVNLQDVGLTDRYNRNRAQSNFKEIEDAVNSNAITAEEMYAELNGKLAAEDKNLQSQIDDKASIEDLNNAKAEWLARAKHIALGTDLETVEAAVVMVLQKRGMI